MQFQAEYPTQPTNSWLFREIFYVQNSKISLILRRCWTVLRQQIVRNWLVMPKSSVEGEFSGQGINLVNQINALLPYYKLLVAEFHHCVLGLSFLTRHGTR